MKQWAKGMAIVAFFCCMVGCAAGNQAKFNHQQQANAIRQLGEAYMAEQNYTMALSEFLNAEKLDPKDYLLYQDLGIVYMAKGEPETAIPQFKKALEIKPDLATAKNNLGAAYLAMKDWDSAIACFKSLTKDLLYATPHYPLANLGKAYYEKKEFTEAEKYYQEALKVEPGFVNALIGLGKTYISMGKVQQAAEYFQRAVEAAPLLAEAQFELADANRLLGDLEKAKQGYARVIELSPNTDLAREAKQAIYDLR